MQIVDAFLGMFALALWWWVVPPSDRRLTFTWSDVRFALGTWAALAAILLGAFWLLDVSVRGSP